MLLRNLSRACGAAALAASCAALFCAGSLAIAAPPEPSAAEAPTAAPAPPPDFVTKALARETEPGPERQLLGPDGAFKASVRSKVVEVTPGEEFVLVELDLGGESNANCLLYAGSIDLASSVVTFSNDLLGRIAKENDLESKQIQRLDAAVQGSSPIFALSWLYRVRGAEGPLVGQLKLRVTSRDGKGIVCFHDELGYE